MITTETLATIQRLGASLLITPVFTTDGPALDLTLESGKGNSTSRWVGRAMGPELVDRCIQRGLPTLIERMAMFRKEPEDTVR